MLFRLFWLSCLYLVFISQGNNYSGIKLITAIYSTDNLHSFEPFLMTFPNGIKLSFSFTAWPRGDHTMFKDAKCVYVIFQEALKTCCLHGIQIKYFSGQFHCFSDCVVNNNLRKTKYSVALHVFNGGKHSILCEF